MSTSFQRTFRNSFATLCCLLSLFAACGCDPPGTTDNLKADYDRVVKERDDLKADFEKRKAEIESVWQQRVTDKDQKISELTTEDANLRQRLLAADADVQDIPLTDAARSRSVIWLHVIYILIICICVMLIGMVMRVHVALRERLREFVMRQASDLPNMGVGHVH